MIFATPLMQNHCFHCPETLQKGEKISSKKYSATRLPQNRQFSVQGDPGWHHEPKRVPKGPQNRASRAANFLWKSMILGGPPPLPLPKSPKASISEALLINFEPFLTVSNPFLSTCFNLVCACSRNDSQWFNNCVKDIDTLKKSTMGNHFETEETQGKLES